MNAGKMLSHDAIEWRVRLALSWTALKGCRRKCAWCHGHGDSARGPNSPKLQDLRGSSSRTPRNSLSENILAPIVAKGLNWPKTVIKQQNGGMSALLEILLPNFDIFWQKMRPSIMCNKVRDPPKYTDLYAYMKFNILKNGRNTFSSSHAPLLCLTRFVDTDSWVNQKWCLAQISILQGHGYNFFWRIRPVCFRKSWSEASDKKFAERHFCYFNPRQNCLALSR